MRNVIGGLFGVLGCVLRFGWLMLLPKAVLVAKLLAAESQLVACVDAVNRRKAPKPRFDLSFLSPIPVGRTAFLGGTVSVVK